MRESAGVWVQVISLHTLCPVGGATMGACEGECWGVGSSDLPAHTVPVGEATVGACEGECWGVGSSDLPAHTVPSGRGYRGCM